MMPPVDLELEHMYSLLDYSTWILYSEGERVGGVMLNSADCSVSFWADDFESPLTEFLSGCSYRWWVNWLLTHKKDEH